jgi:hypothetical protein
MYKSTVYLTPLMAKLCIFIVLLPELGNRSRYNGFPLSVNKGQIEILLVKGTVSRDF